VKVLVFATDTLPIAGLPTSGTALRTHGIVQGLRAHGHQVQVSVPRNAVAGLKRSFDLSALSSAVRQSLAELELLAFDSFNQSDIVDSIKPDAIICGHWPAMILQTKPTQALIIDLAGPHLLERHYQGSPNQDAAVLAKVAIVATADGYIVSGPSQREYFKSFMARAGVNPEGRICTVTMPLSPEIPPPRANSIIADADYPRFIFGGVFLPWQDPALALRALGNELTEREIGSLTLIGGRHPNYKVNEGTYTQLFEELSANPRITTHPMLPFDRFSALLAEADVALDLMAWNMERELAMTIRSTTYLWAGLPVIYNDFADLAGVIKSYEAGWCLDPADPQALVDTLDQIYRSPEEVRRRSHNATKLARELFSWDRAVLPILELIERKPQLESRQVDIIVDSPENADFNVLASAPVCQFFVCRQDDLRRVEVRIATHSRWPISPLRVSLSEVQSSDYSGASLTPTVPQQLIMTQEFPPDQLNNNEWLVLQLPQALASRGKIYCLTLESSEPSIDHSISPWTVRANPFPLISFFYGGSKLDRAALCLRTICLRPANLQTPLGAA